MKITSKQRRQIEEFVSDFDFSGDTHSLNVRGREFYRTEIAGRYVRAELRSTKNNYLAAIWYADGELVTVLDGRGYVRQLTRTEYNKAL